MTAREFVKKIPEKMMDYELAVAKHDNGQACCSTTVPVSHIWMGFDWTAGKVVIEPSVELSTSPETASREKSKILAQYASRVANAMKIAAQISQMLEDVPDASLREKIRCKLREM